MLLKSTLMAIAISIASGCTSLPSHTSSPDTLPRSTPILDVTSNGTDVVIIGAGLAGLVTAYELHKRGLKTHILEAQARAGGRVSTADYGNGLTGEYGMQEIWSTNPLIGIARELGVDLIEEYEHCAHSSFQFDGTIYPDIYDGTMAAHWNSFLSTQERQALEDFLIQAQQLRSEATRLGLSTPAIHALQDHSYKDWVLSRPELSQLARVWLRLHVEVELGADWSQFSALFALLEMEIFFKGGAACYSVEGGNSRLIEALVEKSGPATMSARVVNIKRFNRDDEQHFVRISYIKDNRIRTLQARRVVVAVPFYNIHQIQFEPPLSDEHWQAIRTLERGHYIAVHLIMDGEGTMLHTATGIELTDAILTNGPLGVIYGPVASNERQTLFSLLIYGDHAKAFHMAPQAAKVTELLRELDRIQSGFSDKVIDAYVYRYHPAAIPIWPPGRSPLDELSTLMRQTTDGLYFVGDYLFSGHSDGAVSSGIAVAEQIDEGM